MQNDISYYVKETPLFYDTVSTSIFCTITIIIRINIQIFYDIMSKQNTLKNFITISHGYSNLNTVPVCYQSTFAFIAHSAGFKIVLL